MEKVHSYNIEINKCPNPNCFFYNSEFNVKKHLNSKRNKNGKLCEKYKTEYSSWYYKKIMNCLI
jgi:hypothetical protein